MSGPKGVRYAVVSRAELRRRATEAAKNRLSLAEVRWDALIKAIARAQDEVGPSVSTPVRPASSRSVGREPEAVERAAQDLLDYCEEAESTLRGELAAARASALVQRLAQIAEGGTTRVDRTAPRTEAVPAAPPPTVAITDDSVRREQSAQRQLARVDADVPDEVRERLVALAGSVLSADDATGELLLTSLRNRVQQANRAAEQRRTTRAWADGLTARLSLLELAETTTLRADIAAAAETDVDPEGARSMEAAVEAVEAEERREHDRRFAAQALEESLSALGYEAEESFVTMLVRDGTAHVRAQSWDDHAVRVRLPADGERLGFNVVRQGPAAAGADRDVDAERTWCTDFGDLSAFMREHGVETELVRAQPPGALPLQVVAPGAATFPGRRSGTRAADAQRGRR